MSLGGGGGVGEATDDISDEVGFGLESDFIRPYFRRSISCVLFVAY